jgi:7-cyano-7-deazaguanine synthase in queuosine biosynthesis
MSIEIDLSQVTNIRMAGIDHSDYPDYCDAFIESADYMGREATEEELDAMNDDSDFRYECTMNHIY